MQASLRVKVLILLKFIKQKIKSYWLHLERSQIHNPKSLFVLDEELYTIADEYGIIYDGFDVGNLDKDKPIERDTYAVPEEFKTIDFQKDKYPCLLIVNTAFDRFPHQEEFGYFIKVTTPNKKDDKMKLPIDGELKNLEKFESYITNNLTQNKIENYYVFRDTHKGIRNFYIVTNDKIAAIQVLNVIKMSGKQRTFDFEILTDKGWNLYNEFRNKMPND